MSSFKYNGLSRNKNEIRLLSCARPPFVSSPAATFRSFSLEHVSLDSKPNFVALSYVWGPKDPPIEIHVSNNDHSQGDLVLITENLAHALHELIDSAHGLPVWIDAICINQKDDNEKSWQVALMRSIYGSAASVLVWLGPDTDGAGIAVTQLDFVGEQICEEPDILKWEMRYWFGKFSSPQLLEDVAFGGDKNVEMLLQKYPISDQLNATISYGKTRELLKRPWWQRVWVLQEIVIPAMTRTSAARSEKIRQIIFACGTSRSTLFHFAPALTLFRLNDLARMGMLYEAEDASAGVWLDQRPFMMASARMWITKVSLYKLLRATSDYTFETGRLCASDPRDRVYALLGVSSDSDELGIVPDYSKSCSDTYKQTAAALIRVHGPTVALFSQFPKKLNDLPSWVADWSAEPKGYLIHLPDGGTVEHGFDKLLANVKPHFSPIPADAKPETDIEFAESGSVLRIQGARVDTISQLLPDEEWQRFLTTVAKLLDPSKFASRPHAIYSSHFETPQNEEEAKDRKGSVKRAKNIDMGFFLPTQETNLKNLTMDDREAVVSMNAAAIRNLQHGLRLNPYAGLEYVDTKDIKPLVECIQKLHSEMRTLCAAESNAYADSNALENAIWRTPVADQSTDGRKGWVRPSKDVRSSIIFVHGYGLDEPPRLKDLSYKAWIEHIHDKLDSSGMFEGDLKFETVRFIVSSPKDVMVIVVALYQDELRLAVPRHDGDGRPEDDFFSILFKPLDELALILCELGALKNRQYKDRATVKNDLASGAIHFSEITDAAHAEISNNLKMDISKIMSLSQSARAYARQASTQAIGRKIFASTKGYLGLGPQHMQIGDVIAAWRELPSLVILRPVGPKRYRFVGEAYVHGVMEGELFSRDVPMEGFEVE